MPKATQRESSGGDLNTGCLSLKPVLLTGEIVKENFHEGETVVSFKNERILPVLCTMSNKRPDLKTTWKKKAQVFGKEGNDLPTEE